MYFKERNIDKINIVDRAQRHVIYLYVKCCFMGSYIDILKKKKIIIIHGKRTLIVSP